MSGVEILLIGLAILALLGVVFEEVTHISKAKITLFTGTLSWVILYLTAMTDSTTELVNHHLEENIAEIASLWLFLVAAMTFVAYLNKKRMIESLINRMLPSKISERKLLFMTGLFAFFFSSLADNITATLVSVAMILPLGLPKEKVIKFAVLAVFAVNSGGVALITGDVTTLMIFLEGKTEIQNLLWLSLPALCSVILLAAMLSFGMKGQITLSRNRIPVNRVDMLIAAIFLTTILLTILGNIAFKIPPVLSFLCGLSVMFLVAHFLRKDNDEDPILDYIRRIEFDTLLFFLGILLLVGMLKQIHVLDVLIKIYDVMPLYAANYVLGVMSSFIDNVPLTAALLKADIHMDPGAWLSLTYAVGVGGSLLVIGSAAGIVAMSKVPGLTFGRFAKFSLPLVIAYSFGYLLVHYLGQFLFGQ